MAQSKRSRSFAARKYQRAIRAIKQRGKTSHKVAQQVYRSRREVLGSGLFAAQFKRYSKPYFQGLVREARKVPRITRRLPPEKLAPPPSAGETVLFDGELGEQVAFDLENISEGEIVNERLEPFGLIQKMTIAIESFVGGASAGVTIITRELIPKEEFWRTYYSMIREVLNDSYSKFGKENAIAIVVTQITVI